MPEGKREKTETAFVRNAGSDQGIRNQFILHFVEFLNNIILGHEIMTGRGLCRIYCPQGLYKQILKELKSLMSVVCLEFLDKKATDEKFMEALQNAHRGLGEKHISVRTTLQYMFVNRLRRYKDDNLIVNFTGNDIELYLKNNILATQRQLENLSGPGIEPTAAVPYDRDELRELLRHFRILLTRLAGKGDTDVYPTSYECYCLYHDCFGTDRERIVRSHVSDPEERSRFLTMDDWTDETVGALLAYRYAGVRQPRTNRRVSCGRKTVNNRRRAYQKLLSDCILFYMPEAKPEEVRDMLDARDLDADAVTEFCTDFIRRTGMSHAEAQQNMKTRTLVEPK